MRLEEPIREMVLDLDDAFLQREIVLDARLHRVDLDRGEVLPRWTFGDLHRLSFLARTELDMMRRYVALPTAFDAQIDTAAVVLAGRAFSNAHRQRAERLWLSVPDQDGPEPLRLHQRFILERAELEAERSKRWAALAKTLAAKPA
jgi:hypothetical protein